MPVILAVRPVDSNGCFLLGIVCVKRPVTGKHDGRSCVNVAGARAQVRAATAEEQHPHNAQYSLSCGGTTSRSIARSC